MKLFSRICFILSLGIFHDAQAAFQPASVIKTTQFSNDDKSKMGEQSGQAVTSATNESTSENSPINKNHAAALLEALKEIPPPKTTIADRHIMHVGLYDPTILEDPEACERNYDLPCPENYDFIGDVTGNKTVTCQPSSEYDGPCSGSTIDSAAMSLVTKKNWAMQCKTNWPCKICARRLFSQECPSKWAPVDSNNRRQVCAPTPEYSGPCTGYKMDFAGFNIAMKQRWSGECRAWWPCSEGESDSEGPDADYPITRHATMWRLLKGLQR